MSYYQCVSTAPGENWASAAVHLSGKSWVLSGSPWAACVWGRLLSSGCLAPSGMKLPFGGTGLSQGGMRLLLPGKALPFCGYAKVGVHGGKKATGAPFSQSEERPRKDPKRCSGRQSSVRPRLTCATQQGKVWGLVTAEFGLRGAHQFGRK